MSMMSWRRGWGPKHSVVKQAHGRLRADCLAACICSTAVKLHSLLFVHAHGHGFAACCCSIWHCLDSRAKEHEVWHHCRGTTGNSPASWQCCAVLADVVGSANLLGYHAWSLLQHCALSRMLVSTQGGGNSCSCCSMGI